MFAMITSTIYSLIYSFTYLFIYICLFIFWFIYLCIRTRFTDVFHVHSTYHFHEVYTAISRKVVGKSARDNPEGYCGWFLVHCSLKKFERMGGEATDICLRVLKESKKSRFDSYSVRNSVLIISHITFRDCRVHIFPDNLSRNSCIYYKLTSGLHTFQMALLAQFDKTFQSSRFEPR